MCSRANNNKLASASVVFFLIAAARPVFVFGADPLVRFDVPAVAEATLITPLIDDTDQRIIELTLSVSAMIGQPQDELVEDLRFEVYWNQMAYPIVDYSPKTMTQSGLAGNINVESKSDKNVALNLNCVGGSPEVLAGTGNVKYDSHRGTTVVYEAIPQHEPFVASGPVKRGTGAFFRFWPSKIENLEGGRDLIVSFRVPNSWRGGLIEVDCQATVRRQIIGTWSESVEESALFVVPVYLTGDQQARNLAGRFAQAEQRLRRKWVASQSDNDGDPGDYIRQLFGGQESTGRPEQWLRSLVRSGNDQWLLPQTLAAHQLRLPNDLKVAARSFVNARQDMLDLSQ